MLKVQRRAHSRQRVELSLVLLGAHACGSPAVGQQNLGQSCDVVLRDEPDPQVVVLDWSHLTVASGVECGRSPERHRGVREAVPEVQPPAQIPLVAGNMDDFGRSGASLVENVVGRAFVITWPLVRFGMLDYHHDVYAGVPDPVAGDASP